MRNETLFPTDDYASRPVLPVAKGSGIAGNGTLIDQYGRKITYLRLSVTDRCDFRCTYCMSEDMVFLPRSEILSLEEALRIVRCFVELGVFKVRITGGEPLVRRDVLWLLENISALPGVRELVMTTNGSQLDHFAVPLVKAGVKRLNVSLDTLNAERFHQIIQFLPFRRFGDPQFLFGQLLFIGVQECRGIRVELGADRGQLRFLL